MGIFDRFRKPPVTIVDPVFGELMFSKGWWDGYVGFPGASEHVGLSIDADERGPTDDQRRAFQELVIRYAGVRAGIGEALWTLYAPMREETQKESGARGGPGNPDAMLASTALQVIFLKPHGHVELLFAFTPDVGWDDAMFSIGFEDWKPVPVSLDD